MNYFNEDGHLTDESIAHYVEVLQSQDWDSLPVEILDHIENCDSCHQAGMDLYAIVSHSRQAVEVPTQKPQSGARIVRLRVMRWAMAAVLVGLSFYLYRYLDRPTAIDNIEIDSPIANEPGESKPLDGEVAETPLVPAPKKEETENPSKTTTPVPERDVRDLYAANFVPSESMELLLADQLRSTGLEVIKPANEKVEDWKNGIDFRWVGIEEEGLSIQLENNLGEQLYEQAIEGLAHKVELDLEPGIYYWRLESQEDLLMVGRLVLE